MNNTTNDFKQIVLGEIPLIDVRAPIEFEKGAFINSFNLPIMNDEERRLVGICYKELGNEAATNLGHQLVSGNLRQDRINAWINYINQYPNSMMYCFRGGTRSSIAQEWLYDASGKEITRLEGGYKAFRNYLMDELEPIKYTNIPILLGGCTGAGKTQLLKKLDNSIDLEKIANHRGSSFGRYLSQQPSQINFENNLAYALIQYKDKGYRHLILEDEGRNIGRSMLPKPLFEYFNNGNLVLINASLEERVKNTVEEYVIESQHEYCLFYGVEQGLISWNNYIKDSITRISKRLGGECYKRIMDAFDAAYLEQIKTDKKHLHQHWIEILLKEYYDPMYEYQLQKTTKEILFQGSFKETFDYLKLYYSDKY